MNTTKAQQESISEIKRQRTSTGNAYLVGALLFVALISGGGATSASGESLSTRDMLWAGFSVAAFGLLLWTLYFSYQQADERKQLIQLKAASLTFLAVIFSIVTAQILQALNVVTMTISIQFIVIGGIVLWMSLMKVFERRSS